MYIHNDRFLVVKTSQQKKSLNINGYRKNSVEQVLIQLIFQLNTAVKSANCSDIFNIIISFSFINSFSVNGNIDFLCRQYRFSIVLPLSYRNMKTISYYKRKKDALLFTLESLLYTIRP